MTGKRLPEDRRRGQQQHPVCCHRCRGFTGLRYRPDLDAFECADLELCERAA